MDGGILFITSATTLEFWLAGVSEILRMKLEELHRDVSLGPEKHLIGHIRVQNDSSTPDC